MRDLDLDGKFTVVLSHILELRHEVDRQKKERTLAWLTALVCLLVAGFAVAFGINRGEALKEQVHTNNEVVCAQARSTALAFHERLPHESIAAFVERIAAQRVTLLLVGPLDCPSVDGFATFPYLRARALNEIERLLGHYASDKLKREFGVRRVPSSPRHAPVAAATSPNLPSPSTPADGGGIGKPGPSGGKGDSTGGPGIPTSPPHHHPHHPSKPHPSPPAEEGGGHEETTPVTAPVQQPPSQAPATGEEGGEQAEPPSEAANEHSHSVLSPVLDGTCDLPVVSGLLCTPR